MEATEKTENHSFASFKSFPMYTTKSNMELIIYFYFELDLSF